MPVDTLAGLCTQFKLFRRGKGSYDVLCRVCFGTNAGPWNHSARLAKQPNVQFTAIVDPDVQLAQVRPGHIISLAHLNSSGQH